jgi:hypothetical protein
MWLKCLFRSISFLKFFFSCFFVIFLQHHIHESISNIFSTNLHPIFLWLNLFELKFHSIYSNSIKSEFNFNPIQVAHNVIELVWYLIVFLLVRTGLLDTTHIDTIANTRCGPIYKTNTCGYETNRLKAHPHTYLVSWWCMPIWSLESCVWDAVWQKKRHYLCVPFEWL